MLHHVKQALAWYVRKAAETYNYSQYFNGFNKQ